MSGILRILALAALFLLTGRALHAQNCTINAGVTTAVCPNDQFLLSGSSSGLIAVNPVWTQISGPAVIIKQPAQLKTAVSGYTAGNTYKFRLSAKCTDGSLIYDEVVYTTHPATLANAGADISICAPGSQLHANTVGAGETGTWTIEGNANGISFSPSQLNNPNLTITSNPEQAGTATLRWTITSNNSCRSYDDIVITHPGGVMPVTAGTDQVLSHCYTTTQSTQLHASFGGNNTNGQQGTWSVLSGPTVPAFSNIHDNHATVSNLSTGTYKLRWTVQGPCANGVADVVLTVPTGTQSVTVAKDGNATFCDGRSSTIITGLSPAYAGETITWSRESGTGDIVSPHTPATEISNLTGVKSVFSYTISNPVTGCQTTGKYTINYTAPPTITAPSPVLAPCDATLVTIQYNYTGGDKTQWALISAPAGVSTTDFADAGQPLLLPPYTVPGTYLVRLKRTTNNGFGGCQDQYADVYVQIAQSPTAANAGTRQVLACKITETHLAGNTPVIGTGTWSQISGPNTARIADKKDPTTLIDGLINGTYTFRWIISGGKGCPNQQADVQVVVSDINPTAAAAGPDVTICNASPYKLQGNKPTLNENGVWTVTPNAGVVFSDPTDPQATVDGLAPNISYTFTWTIKNSCGQDAAQVRVTTSATAGPKQANAGPDQCLPTGTAGLSLAGNAPTNGETGKWSLITGNSITFTNPNANNTGVTGATDGSYQLQWRLSKNGCPDTYDTVLYTISAPATTAAAGNNQQLCDAKTIALNGNTPAIGSGYWTQQQGPGGITIVAPASPATAVNNLADGRYIFRWTISNGACAANFSDVTFDITSPPTIANAGPDQIVCGVNTAALAGNTITTGTGTWSVISGPSNPKFANPAAPATTVSELKTGVYKLLWTANSGPDCPVSTDEVVLTVREKAKVQTLTQQLCNATSAVVSANEGSIGSWTQTGGPAGTIIAANSGNSAVITNMIPGNTYQFTYTIAAVPGCASSSAATTVITSALPSPADAGADQQFCLPEGQTNVTATLAASAPASGVGTWTLATKPAGVPDPVIKNPSLLNTQVEQLQPGIYVFSWTVSNGHCTSNTDIMRIVVSATPSDPLPGADQTNACINNILLNATTPTSGIGTWSFETVPNGNTAIIEGINSPSTKVLGTQVGQYTFRWTVSNGVCASKSALINVNVTSTPPNPAVANVDNLVAGEHCIGSGTGTNIKLNANAPQGIETGKWTITYADGSPVALSFTDNDPTTTVANVGPGAYLLRWAITSGSCASISDLPITVYASPTPADAGVSRDICLYSPLTLAAQPPAVGTGKWSILATPGTAPAFDNDQDPVTSVTGLAVGAYKFRWTTSHGICPVSTADVTVNVDDCGIKVVKTASIPVQQADGSYDVTFTFKLSNPGSLVTINNVLLTDYIPAGLPANATYTVLNHSISGIGGYNNSFDGKNDTNVLLANTASLAAGTTATITITINVKFF
ncbi:hypothetical protein [Chitinophaga nivalis]|uniref:DUF11 domain-containing protein n=1 Tax=Chitinophaga nivalis TaxID=2991709 RepID=A0ABT3IJL7_9BACT|nr:hypothetical protein [Chitinophaga nivalis]MCW3466161.1 hypothetical protein [Chitinophaga nivalis]MCW3484148.1 hypothetical protein [Chitinophaga nivalis]